MGNMLGVVLRMVGTGSDEDWFWEWTTGAIRHPSLDWLEVSSRLETEETTIKTLD